MFVSEPVQSFLGRSLELQASRSKSNGNSLRWNGHYVFNLAKMVNIIFVKAQQYPADHPLF